MPAPKSHIPVSVIAGGAGFIGSHLAEALLAQGQRVVVLDNYSTGKADNLTSLYGNDKFSFKIGDINQGLPELEQVDYIYHLAGLEEYLDGLDVSLGTLLVNSLGTKNLLELARLHQAKVLLASSPDLYAGLLSALSFDHYLGPESRDGQLLSHHEAKRYAEVLTTEYFRKFGVDARIVRLADVYGPRQDLRSGTEMAVLLAEAIQPEPRLTIHGEGLGLLHPTYVSDVIYGLVKAAQSEGTRGKVYHLVNPKSETVLNFAHALKRAVPQAEIVVGAELAEVKTPPLIYDIDLAHQELGWHPTISLDQGIARTLSYLQTLQEVPAVPELPVRTEKLIHATPQKPSNRPVEKDNFIQPFSVARWLSRVVGLLHLDRAVVSKITPHRGGRRWPLAAAVAFIAITVLLPVLTVLGSAGYGAWRLQGSGEALAAGQLDDAATSADSAAAAFQNGGARLGELTWLISLLQLRDQAENYRHLFNGAESVAAAAKSSAAGLKPLFDLGQNLVKTDVAAEPASGEARDRINQATTNLELADDHLTSAQSEIDLVARDSLPGPLSAQLANLASQVRTMRATLNQTRVLAHSLPELLGLDSPRTYLILLTNSANLRGGGGVVESYGWLRFEGGGLREFVLQDSPTLDSALTLRSSSPAPLRDYLAIPYNTLRDSAWSPDFPASAALASSILSSATKRQSQGVVVLDTQALVNLLRVLGPVSLADFGEEVTAENFKDRAQLHAETPAATKGASFMSSVGRIVLDKALRAKTTLWPGLLQAFGKSLHEKDLAIYMASSDLSGIVTENGWGGAIAPVVSQIGEVGDYLLTVDSNVGGNLANYYVQSQADYEVTADKAGNLRATLTLTYDHTATSDTWPSGRYRDFLRIYTPFGSTLGQVDLTGVSGNPAVTTAVEGGKTVFGFYFELPTQTKRVITISYNLPMKLPTIAQETQYRLTWQKQAGTGSRSTALKLSLPPSWQIGAAGESPVGAPYQSSQTQTADQQFNLTLTP